MKLDELENTLLDQIEKLNGGVDSDPEITRVRILQARIRAAQLDLGEKAGFVRTYGRGRVEVKNSVLVRNVPKRNGRKEQSSDNEQLTKAKEITLPKEIEENDRNRKKSD